MRNVINKKLRDLTSSMARWTWITFALAMISFALPPNATIAQEDVSSDDRCQLTVDSSPEPPTTSQRRELKLLAEFFDPLRMHAVQGLDLLFVDGRAKRLAVATGGLHNLAIFNTSLEPELFQRAPNSIEEPNRGGDVAFFPNGNLAMVTYDSPHITIFEPDGSIAHVFSSDQNTVPLSDQLPISLPVGLDILNNEDVMFADRGNNRIVVARISGEYINIIEFDWLKAPYDLLQVADCIVVSDRESLALWVLHKDGTFSHRLNLTLAGSAEDDDISPTFQWNQHLALAPDGYFYIADTKARRIVVFHPSGVIKYEAVWPDMGVVRSAVVDENGHIYAGGFRADAQEMQYPGREARIFKFSLTD